MIQKKHKNIKLKDLFTGFLSSLQPVLTKTQIYFFQGNCLINMSVPKRAPAFE